jgi:hypothetical protein
MELAALTRKRLNSSVSRAGEITITCAINLSMNLEAKVTKGIVTLIHSVDYDIAHKSLVVNFFTDPDQVIATKRLIFSKVQDYSEQFHNKENEEDDIEQLIGLDEYPQEVGTKYVINTNQRELIFFTAEKPQLTEKDVTE